MTASHDAPSLWRRVARWPLVPCLLLATGVAASSGSGTFQNGKYNFCVSVRFNATAAQLAQIRTAFENAGAVLLDATDGQQQFGTITIVNNSGASEAA